MAVQLKQTYQEKIVPKLMRQFDYSNIQIDQRHSLIFYYNYLINFFYSFEFIYNIKELAHLFHSKS